MTGVTSVTFRKSEPKQIIDMCKNAGLECIEWGGDIHVKPGDIKTAEETASATQEAGLKVSSYGSYFRVGINETEEFCKVVATASALNAPIIRVWCGDIPSAKSDELIFKKYVTQLREICDIAGKNGITVACEYHNNTFNDNGSSAVRLIESVEKENFKTYWQTVAYGDEDFEAIKVLKKHIVVAHVFTWNKLCIRYGLDRKYSMWERYINELKTKNINFILEFVKNDSPSQFEKDAKTLNKLVYGIN